jgi:hypothetical protein
MCASALHVIAIAAGVESRLWEFGDIVKFVEEWEAALTS